MSTWTVAGTQIQKDGQSVFLAGVCYAPTPAGAATYTPGVGDWFAPPWNGIWERDFALMKGMGINNLRTYFCWAWTPPDDMRTWQAVTSQPPTFDHTAFLDAAAANGPTVAVTRVTASSGTVCPVAVLRYIFPSAVTSVWNSAGRPWTR